jgi:hypothetical protein
MNEARPYASLSSGLLARKGTAKPAMRPQNYGSLEDLGWNDMGQGAEPNAPPPPAEHVPSSIAALTPAPKIQRTNPTDAHLPHASDEEEYYGGDEGYEGEEGYEAQEAFEPVAPIEPAAFEPEPVASIEPVAFEAEPIEPIVAEPIAAEPPAPIELEIPEPAQPVAEVETPPVVAQQRAILERFDAEDLVVAAAAAASADPAEIVPLPSRQSGAGKRKAAFTLRLDAERHLRLRLACAVTRHSAQQIVARALDEALASIPEIEALASQVPAKPGRAGKRH